MESSQACHSVSDLRQEETYFPSPTKCSTLLPQQTEEGFSSGQATIQQWKTVTTQQWKATTLQIQKFPPMDSLFTAAFYKRTSFPLSSVLAWVSH